MVVTVLASMVVFAVIMTAVMATYAVVAKLAKVVA